MSSELRRRCAGGQHPTLQDKVVTEPSSSLLSSAGSRVLGVVARAVAGCFPSVQYVSLPSDCAAASACTAPRLLRLFGQAYDVSAFASVHPGGSIILSQLDGSDCSDAFAVQHPPALVQQARDIAAGGQPRGLLASLHRGVWQPAAPYCRTPLQRDFDAIVAALQAEGRFEPTVGFYLRKAALQLLLLALALALLALANAAHTRSSPPSALSAPLPCSPLVLYSASAVVLGLFWQQMAFLGHDAGHNQITGRARSDYCYAWLVTALFGVSGSWWKRNHNVHHVHTNSIECDPDIQHLPMIAVSEDILKVSTPQQHSTALDAVCCVLTLRCCAAALQGFWSCYHQKAFVLDGVAAFMVRYQHWLYYPLMAVARANLYVQSFLLCLNPAVRVPYRRYELLALAVFWLWFVALLSCLPSPLHRLLYYLLSHAVAGVIHVQITLSHFAMPAYHGPQLPPLLPVASTTRDEHGVERLEPGTCLTRNSLHSAADLFFLTQFSTTMNVDCSRRWDWFHGGLQFQVEHHLLPRLPRQHLRYAMERYIRPFAARHRLPYHTYGFLRSNQLVFQQLRQQAMQLDQQTTQQQQQQPVAGAEAALLWQGVMASG